MQSCATFHQSFFDNLTAGKASCPLWDLRSLFERDPDPTTCTQRLLQCHVLKTEIFTPPSQETAGGKAIKNSCLPNTDLFTCGSPGGRQYRYVVRYLRHYTARRAGGCIMPTRLQLSGLSLHCGVCSNTPRFCI